MAKKKMTQFDKNKKNIKQAIRRFESQIEKMQQGHHFRKDLNIKLDITEEEINKMARQRGKHNWAQQLRYLVKNDEKERLLFKDVPDIRWEDGTSPQNKISYKKYKEYLDLNKKMLEALEKDTDRERKEDIKTKHYMSFGRNPSMYSKEKFNKMIDSLKNLTYEEHWQKYEGSFTNGLAKSLTNAGLASASPELYKLLLEKINKTSYAEIKKIYDTLGNDNDMVLIFSSDASLVQSVLPTILAALGIDASAEFPVNTKDGVKNMTVNEILDRLESGVSIKDETKTLEMVSKDMNKMGRQLSREEKASHREEFVKHHNLTKNYTKRKYKKHKKSK